MVDLTESGRVMAWKRIVNPDDDSEYIDVPCITQITFIDQDDGQEYDHSFDNTDANQARTTHTVTVKNANDDSMTVNVERCTQYSVHENHNDYDIDVIINNNDPAPLGPSGDGNGHAKSHVVRYNQDNTNDPTSTPWVDVELADEVNITGYFPAKDWNLRSSAEMPPTTDDKL